MEFDSINLLPRLLEIATALTNTTDSELLHLLMAPDFSNTRKTHDWRNHVDADIAQYWDLMSPETQIVIYIIAQRAAAREEWE